MKTKAFAVFYNLKRLIDKYETLSNIDMYKGIIFGHFKSKNFRKKSKNDDICLLVNPKHIQASYFLNDLAICQTGFILEYKNINCKIESILSKILDGYESSLVQLTELEKDLIYNLILFNLVICTLTDSSINHNILSIFDDLFLGKFSF
jgi:hypothetical protein